MPLDQRMYRGMSPLKRSYNRQQIKQELRTLLVMLFDILQHSPVDAPPSAAYFSYHLSAEFIRSGNFSQQAELAVDLGSELQQLYNRQTIVILLPAAPRRECLAVLLRLYNLHHALIMSGMRADDGPMMLDAHDALRVLNMSVRLLNPLQSIIGLTGSISSYHRIAIHDPGGGLQIRIGWQLPVGVRVSLGVATLNMQGVNSSAASKFRTIVLPMIRQHHVVTLQEAGVWPTSSVFVADLQVADQFGVTHTVYERRWQAGTSGRPENYTMYYLEVGRLRVRLAIVVNSDVTVLGVRVIADGVPSPSGGYVPRPVLGLRILVPGMIKEVAVYTFHAISNGGSNSPHMLRETVWHTDSPFVMLGDFNRDPRDPTPSHPNSRGWVSPPGISELVPADGPTHPGGQPHSMLNYSFASGLAEPASSGRVMPSVDSDHRPVSYVYSFSS